MKIGYARTSTKDQNLDLQLDALKNTGCDVIYSEQLSSKDVNRQELQKMLEFARSGDMIVVYKLDRLGRSLKHLLEVVNLLSQKGVELYSINDSINTSTPQGRLFFNITASFSEFERELIRERTMAGLEAARARGRKGGRKAGLSKESEQKAILAESYYKEGKKSVNQIIKDLRISKMTFYRYLRLRGAFINDIAFEK